jgi:phosphopentomutase
MRVILLVLDALGIGAMPDVSLERPQDEAANTLGTLAQNVNHLDLDNLIQLGLGRVASLGRFDIPVPSPLASYGRSRLAHKGADSYLGHQEIMGTIPKPPMATLMNEAADPLERQLTSRGHVVRRPLDDRCLLLVDEALVIGDNLEADPGLNINLTVATDLIDFEEALRIGRLVRAAVSVSRVIVFGGPGIDIDDILNHVKQRENGQIGVDSPSLGVYNENLRVQHLGYGVDPQRQAASILSQAGIPVILLGKMADLIVCTGAITDPVVPTPQVMQTLLHSYLETREGLIAATVQETDLAAHEGDLLRLASVLEEVDKGLGALLPKMAPGDVLIICADHGNDPQLNVGLHTREETPLLIYEKAQPARSLGIRDTLADIGATISHLFHVPATQDGSIIDHRRTP